MAYDYTKLMVDWLKTFAKSNYILSKYNIHDNIFPIHDRDDTEIIEFPCMAVEVITNETRGTRINGTATNFIGWQITILAQQFSTELPRDVSVDISLEVQDFLEESIKLTKLTATEPTPTPSDTTLYTTFLRYSATHNKLTNVIRK